MRIAQGRVYLFGEVYEGGPKSRAGKRVFPLPTSVVTTLRSWRVAQAEERLLLRAAWGAGDLVVTGSIGQPVDRGNLTRRFKQLCTRAGVPPIRLYDLRHTFGSLTVRGGADYKTVATLMGHSDTMTLQRVYQHPYADMQRMAVERLAAVLDGDIGADDAGASGA
jgi:integrase